MDRPHLQLGVYWFLPSEIDTNVHNRTLSVPTDETLAGTLSEAGYKTVGFSPNPWVTPEFDFDRGFDEFYNLVNVLPFDDAPDPLDEDWGDGPQKSLEMANWCMSENPIKRVTNSVYTKFTRDTAPTSAETVTTEVTEWIRGCSKNPHFAFVNYMDAHEPYRIHEDYLDRSVEEIPDIIWNLGSHENELSSEQRQQLEAVYDASLWYLDAQFGALLDTVDETGRETVVMVASDHGQSLGEHGFWGHGSTFMMNSSTFLFSFRPMRWTR